MTNEQTIDEIMDAVFMSQAITSDFNDGSCDMEAMDAHDQHVSNLITAALAAKDAEIAALKAYSERLNVENNELLAEVSACSDLALRLDSAAPDAAGAFSGTPSERIGRQIARLLFND